MRCRHRGHRHLPGHEPAGACGVVPENETKVVGPSLARVARRIQAVPVPRRGPSSTVGHLFRPGIYSPPRRPLAQSQHPVSRAVMELVLYEPERPVPGKALGTLMG